MNGLAFKYGTHLLATTSDDMTGKIWDAEKGVCIRDLKVIHGFCHLGCMLVVSGCLLYVFMAMHVLVMFISITHPFFHEFTVLLCIYLFCIMVGNCNAWGMV